MLYSWPRFSSSTITSLQGNLSPPHTLLVYFYWGFQRFESLDPGNILGSVASQLCSILPKLAWASVQYEPIIFQRSKNTRTTFPRNPIGSVVQEHELFLVIDSLDECEECASLLSLLANIPKNSLNVRLFVMNRDEVIRIAFNSLPKLYLGNLSEVIAVDIHLCIKARFDNCPTFGWIQPCIKDEIIKKLTSHSDCSRIWVHNSKKKYWGMLNTEGFDGFATKWMRFLFWKKSRPSEKPWTDFHVDWRRYTRHFWRKFLLETEKPSLDVFSGYHLVLAQWL